jgi:CheY-like chemotaxis protein
LVEGAVPSSSRIVLACRSDSDYASLPIIVLADRVSDLAFGETFNNGADDIVNLGVPHALTRRLRILPALPTPVPSPTRGAAIVAIADQTRRVVVGRVLRNAGYAVTFALDAPEATRFAAEHSAVFVLVDSSMIEDPLAVILAARDVCPGTVWILSTTPKNLAGVRAVLAGVENAVIVDGYSTPEDVLFAYNEHKNGGRVGQRASTRLLYGTTVAMRPEGYESDDFGFTYNVSASGLYIRTLAVPEQNTIWLELLPPRTERRVRLVGEVAWRRHFEPSTQTTVPPGFGLRIIDGARRDLEAWTQGCASFERAFS